MYQVRTYIQRYNKIDSEKIIYNGTLADCEKYMKKKTIQSLKSRESGIILIEPRRYRAERKSYNKFYIIEKE